MFDFSQGAVDSDIMERFCFVGDLDDNQKIFSFQGLTNVQGPPGHRGSDGDRGYNGDRGQPGYLV